MQIEQSRLARNLSLLKNLKSEATRLKTAVLVGETECPGNFIAESIRRSVDSSEKTFAPRTQANEKKSVNDSENASMASSQILTSLKLSPKHDFHGSGKSGESNDCLNQKNLFDKMNEKNANDSYRVTCVSSSTKSHSLGAPSSARRIIEFNIESDALSSIESKTVDLSSPFNAGDQKRADDDIVVNCVSSSGVSELNVESVARRSRDSKAVDLRKPFEAGDSKRNSPVGESFLKTKTSSSRESRRPRFRAPAFLRDMLRSNGNSGPGEKSLSTEKNDDPTHVVAEKSGETSEPSSSSRSSINSSHIDLSNHLRGQETPASDGNDCKVLDDETPYGHKQSGKFCGGSIVDDECVNKKESTQSGGETGEPILVTAENLEPNTVDKDHSTMSEEDSFIRSLPLTGDHEIDEEIIAFYRAKRSGGLY